MKMALPSAAPRVVTLFLPLILGLVMAREPSAQAEPPALPDLPATETEASDPRPDMFPSLLSLDSRKGELRVVSYNIFRGEQTATVAGILKALNADLVALQEVDVRTTRVDGRDVLEELAALTGYHSVFGKAIDHAGGEYGVGVLSRFPIAEQKVHPLANSDGAEARVALQTQVAVPDWTKPLHFFVTHLDAGENGELRVLQARDLTKLFVQRSETPGILAGDLNALPDSPPLSLLIDAGWVDTVPAEKVTEQDFTHASDDPRKRIDHILLSSRDDWELLRSANALAVGIEHSEWRAALQRASDHLPVIAEIRWQNP